MVSVCTVPARGGRSCEHFGGYKTINRIPLAADWSMVSAFSQPYRIRPQALCWLLAGRIPFLQRG